MDTQDLRELLEKLHTEIKEAGAPIDDKARELLQDVKEDIEGLLDRVEEETSESYEAVTDRLKEAGQHFEASHPTLSTLMDQAIDALNKAGL